MILFTIAKKEFREFFCSPIAYVFLTVFLVLVFWVFFSSFFIQNQASLRVFFSWIPVIFVVFLPAVTMGKWAEEKKSGTFELLLTLPVTDFQAVMGKFLSCLYFVMVALIFTLPLVGTVWFLGDLDLGPVFCGYVGLVLLAAASIAVGLYLSSLTQNSIVAFILSFLVLFVLHLLGESLVVNAAPQFLVPWFLGASLSNHFESISRGVLDSRDLFYYISVTGFFLYLNVFKLSRLLSFVLANCATRMHGAD